MLIFWFGFKLGMIKGFIIAQYEDMNWMHREWETRADDMRMRIQPAPVTPTNDSMPPAAAVPAR
jgi:hypothetical protein